jgi:glutamate-1-semialdehyde 2,1-aminomutase
VRRFSDTQRADVGLFARYWHHMLEHGVYLAPSQFEATMVSLALTDADVARIDEASGAFFSAIRD